MFPFWVGHVDKPPIEELYQFLEFQLPRQWAPVFGELPLGPDRKQQSGASLQFSLMGPKLYVNTNPVTLLLECWTSFISTHIANLGYQVDFLADA